MPLKFPNATLTERKKLQNCSKLFHNSAMRELFYIYDSSWKWLFTAKHADGFKESIHNDDLKKDYKIKNKLFHDSVIHMKPTLLGITRKQSLQKIFSI